MKIVVNSRVNHMILLLLLMMTVPVGCESNLTDQEYLQQAKDYQDLGDLKSSIIQLKNAIVVNPENTEARLLLGLIYLDYGMAEDAEKELRRARELGVPHYDVIVPITKAMLLSREYEQLLNETERLPSVAPNIRASIHALRGEAFYKTNNIEEAMEEYNKALLIDPELPEVEIGLARIALSEGRIDDARQLIETVQSNKPDMSEAWRVLGDLERSQGNASAADSSYSNAIESSLNNANDYLSRAVVRIYSGKYDAAEKDIGSAIAIIGKTSRALYVQGLLYFAQEEFEQAQIEFQKVIRDQSDFVPVYFYLGALNVRLGNYEQARSYLEKYLAAFPGSLKARTLMSYVYLRNNRTLEAIDLLESVLNQQPDNPLVLRILGNIYLANGQVEKGTLYLQNASAQQPDSSDLRMRIGLSLMSYGSKQEGLDELETAFVLDPDNKAVEYQLILANLQAKKFIEAIEMATQMREKQPNDPVALDLLGLAYLGMGEREKALNYFNESLLVSPGDPIAGLSLAREEMQSGHIDNARSLYKQVLSHNPDHQQALARLARLEARHGGKEETRRVLERLVEVYPHDAEGYILLSQYYLRFGRLNNALETISDAAEGHPNNTSVLAALGRVQLRAGRVTSAERTFTKLIDLQPNSAQAHFLMATLYSERGDVEKVQTELGHALRIDPGHLQARIANVRLLLLLNEKTEAEKSLDEMVKAYPDNPHVLDLQGLHLLSDNKPDEAVNVYKRITEIQPSSLNTINLARAQWRTGDHDAGINTLRRWIATNPEDISGKIALANTYLSNNQKAAAIEVYTNVIEQRPRNTIALNNLAWLLRKKKPELALKYAEQAAEITNNDLTAADTLGVILLEQGETIRAVRVLKNASVKAPDNPSINYHLALAFSKAGDTAKAVERLHALIEKSPDYSGIKEARELLKELEK